MLIALLATAATARSAQAAACCVSASAFGVGRLLVWEDFAVGLFVGHARSVGQWSSSRELRLYDGRFADGLTTFEPYAMVRVIERLQLSARVPLRINDRSSAGMYQVAGGFGDVQAGARVEALSPGQFRELPSLAFHALVTAPSGRRAEQVSGPLGAGVTGRGAWVLTFALETEYTWLPWYLRLDAAVSVPFGFRRSDTREWQLYGPLVSVMLSGGRELVPGKLVASLALQAEWEGPVRINGALVARSEAYAFTVAASLSWRVEPHWTLLGSISSSVWPGGFGANRDARVSFNLGGRYGYF